MIEKKKTRQWVLVEEIENGGLWCTGIFDSYESALGKAMSTIFEDKRHSNDEYFEYSLPEEIEGDGGYMITVMHQFKPDVLIWKEHYYILSVDEEQDNDR